MLPNLKILTDGVYKSPPSLEKDILRYISIEHEYPVYERYVGLDSGTRHLGLAELDTHFINLWEITIIRDDTTGKRIQHIWNIMTSLLSDPKTVVIEGASYADRFRQVELQDIRCGATSWAMNRLGNIEVMTVPPLTIRKTVFGSGKIKNPWTELGIPNNAAAALGCALYPIMKENKP